MPDNPYTNQAVKVLHDLIERHFRSCEITPQEECPACKIYADWESTSLRRSTNVMDGEFKEKVRNLGLWPS